MSEKKEKDLKVRRIRAREGEVIEIVPADARLSLEWQAAMKGRSSVSKLSIRARTELYYAVASIK